MEALLIRLVRSALLAAMLASWSGCDYFKPAQPEAPSERQTFVPNYSDPDSTLVTIARSIEDKGVTVGGVAYGNAFADSIGAGLPYGYHQFFDPIDAAAWSSTSLRNPPIWDYSQEQTFYRSFVRLRNDQYVCTWAKDPPNPDDIGANAATIHRHYLIVSQTIEGTQTSFLAIGYADLRMLRFADGAWRIVLWNDRRDPKADPNDQQQQTLGMQRLTAP